MSCASLTISPVVKSVTVSPVQPALIISGVTSIPSGAAGGDLAGSYPNPTVDGLQGRAVASTAPSGGQALVWNAVLSRWEPGSATAVLADGDYGDISVQNGGATLVIDVGAVTANKIGARQATYPKLPATVANTVLGRADAGSGDWQPLTLGSTFYVDPGNYTVNVADASVGTSKLGVDVTTAGKSLLTGATASSQRTTLGLGTGDSPQFTAISLLNGEVIRNTVDGRVDILPKPNASNQVGVTFDMSSIADAVQIGTYRTSNDALNDGRVQWNVPIQTGNNVTTIWGAWQWAGVRMATGSSIPATLQIGVTNYNGGPGDLNGNHVLALVSYSHLGNANRRPTTLYADPQWFVYSADATQPNDFVRMWHDQTDGNIESGNGKMRVKAATRVRIEGSSGGFDLPAGDGSNGQVLTTNGSGNVSWSTPSGGGVTKAFAIAMAVAL